MAGKAQLGPRTGPSEGPSGLNDYVLEEQVGHLLRRAHQRATAIFMNVMADHDLTPRQFAALVKVMDRETVSQNELGRLTAMDPATMQGVMKRLQQRGLVSRRPDPNDGRRMLLSLTATGREACRAAIAGSGVRVTKETLEPLSTEERKAFLRLLKKLT